MIKFAREYFSVVWLLLPYASTDLCNKYGSKSHTTLKYSLANLIIYKTSLYLNIFPYKTLVLIFPHPGSFSGPSVKSSLFELWGYGKHPKISTKQIKWIKKNLTTDSAIGTRFH